MEITRPRYERNYGRYASDCSDEEWALIKPFMPERRSNGRPRTTNLREVWNAIQYMAMTGCGFVIAIIRGQKGFCIGRITGCKLLPLCQSDKSVVLEVLAAERCRS